MRQRLLQRKLSCQQNIEMNELYAHIFFYKKMPTYVNQRIILNAQADLQTQLAGTNTFRDCIFQIKTPYQNDVTKEQKVIDYINTGNAINCMVLYQYSVNLDPSKLIYEVYLDGDTIRGQTV